VIQIAPEMRVLVALEPVDGRNYARHGYAESCSAAAKSNFDPKKLSFLYTLKGA